MKKQRRTPQLAVTWEVLAAAKDHPSAEDILHRVRRCLPRVSLGTVYRNLEKLQGQGRAQMLRFGEGVARYDARVEEHDHFVCEECGRVVDLARGAGAADVTALEREGFVVRSQSTTLYGACPACAGSGRRLQPAAQPVQDPA